jgi:hypothetical protein
MNAGGLDARFRVVGFDERCTGTPVNVSRPPDQTSVVSIVRAAASALGSKSTLATLESSPR